MFDLKNVAVTGLCASGSVKNVRSWMVTTTDTPGRSGIVECGTWMTSTPACWATSGSPVCSQARRAGRCAMAVGPAMTRAFGTIRPYRSSSARWQATTMSAPAAHSATTSPSTYRPSAPRSAGTAVASTSTRGATTSLAPLDPGPGPAVNVHLGPIPCPGSPATTERTPSAEVPEHAARYREAVGLGVGAGVAPGPVFGEVV